MALASDSGCSRSPVTRSAFRSSRLRLSLVGRSSSRKSAPPASNARATCVPTKPVAPVTKAFIQASAQQQPPATLAPAFLVYRWSALRLFQLLRLDLNAGFTGGALFPVLAHPRFPALAGSRVAAGKGERRNVRVRNRNLVARIAGNDAHYRLRQRRPGAPIENVAFNLVPVPLGDGDVAAIIECPLQRQAQLVVAGQLGHPPFQLFVSRAFCDFKLVRVNRMFGAGVAWSTSGHYCEPSAAAELEIWMSGL